MSEQQSQKLEISARAAGAALFAAGMAAGIPAVSLFLENAAVTPWARPLCFIAAWLLVGGDVLLKAVKNIFRGKVFDENFLMTIATVGAFAIGEFPEGAAVMLFYQIGEACQELAVRRSRSSITSLMDLRPDYAMLRKNGEVTRVRPEEVRPGDIIVVRPGEKIALDGTVDEGASFLDTSALTGESAPREIKPGSEVLAGMVNQTALIAVRVTREAGESAAARILKLVKEAEDKKAPVENFITRFARYYTPAVVLGAAALAVVPPSVITLAGTGAGTGAGTAALFSEWLRRALVFLVVSCPCALVVSIPLSFFGGIGAASRRGILVKGGNYLDALNRVDTVVFDKTGTLTRGFFTVAGIFPAPGRAEDEVLHLAAIAESNSNHPIAVSIQREASARGLTIQAETVSYSELAGRGVRHQLADGQTLRAGSRALLAEEGIDVPDELNDAGRYGLESRTGGTFSPQSGTYVYIAENGRCAGALVIADELKSDSKSAVAALKKAGVKTVMLTGDSEAAAEAVAAEAGIDEFYAELLPWEKVGKLEELEAAISSGRSGARRNRNGKNRNIVFAGDGINDAPVLARSGVGIAMGGLGSDAAIEAADIVLMTDEPGKIVEAMEVAARTQGIVRQNIVFSLGVKAALLALGAMGLASLWMAVFGDVGVALIAVLNAARVQGRG
jgi:Cd2+/Zn2+-exporting ATPase